MTELSKGKKKTAESPLPFVFSRPLSGEERAAGQFPKQPL